MKKHVLLLLALFASVSLLHASVVSGTCGDNLTWSFDSETGALVIEGSGEMYYFDFERHPYEGIIEWDQRPWNTLYYSIKSITFQDGLTSISSHAFDGCYYLTSVTIPNSVTSIGDYAFYDCSSLTSVTIGNSVTSIGYEAFSGCSGLTSITIPNSVTSIGLRAFSGCSSLTSVTIGNGVTSIGENTFYECSSLTSVTIGNSVTSIGYEAFSGCSGLTSVTIPNSVTSIGVAAFMYCSSLTSMSVEAGNAIYDSRDNCNAIIETASNTLIAGCKNTIIPNSVTSIGGSAFSGCRGLTSVTIPNSVTSIGDYAFFECRSLTSVTCEAVNPPALGNAVFDQVDKSIPLYVPAEGITAYQAADGWSEFTNIQAIPSSGGDTPLLTEKVQIGDLYYNLNATDQTAEVTYELDWDRNNYAGLTSANIPASVTYSGTTYSVTSIGNYAFVYCSGLTSVTIPNSVTSIGEGAFAWCSSLTSVTIGNSVTSIGRSAFSGCSSLTSVYISDLTVWCNIEFGNIDANPLFNGHNLYLNDTLVTNLVIPSGVTSIGGYAFDGCSGLTSVTIPNSVTSIGKGAFLQCSSLTSIESPALLFNDAFSIFSLSGLEMPSQIKYLTINAGTLTEEGFDRIRASYRNLESVDLANTGNTELSDEAFKGCYNLQTLSLPAGLKEIKYMAVAECKNLQAITIPASVEVIEQSAFEDCRSLASVTFAGADLTTIGSWAFYNCHALTSIDIPAGVTEIGAGAFYGCTYLNNVIVPASVQAIGDNAFALCSLMQEMRVRAVVPPTIAGKTFELVSRQMPVYVPTASVNAYLSDPLWGQMNIIGLDEDISAVDNTTFSTTALKTVINGELLLTLPDGKIYNAAGVKVT